MALSTRHVIGLIIGVFMIGLAIFLLSRPLFPPGTPVTTARWLDVAFAAFFLLRGGMNVRAALRSRDETPR
ncbi:MAG TPA: hypothetical protein VJ672_12245 [Gemmatimonadaceae bacterium]|nr:hypothetical protein [Gemmatimonadaceae bacterium]